MCAIKFIYFHFQQTPKSLDVETPDQKKINTCRNSSGRNIFDLSKKKIGIGYLVVNVEFINLKFKLDVKKKKKRERLISREVTDHYGSISFLFTDFWVGIAAITQIGSGSE